MISIKTKDDDIIHVPQDIRGMSKLIDDALTDSDSGDYL